ncbi:hypothetical protein FOB58_005105 [Candida parapsilosis]|uniref:Uncharacterized protein n=2 Tax=Candida parapsilosis TaxID=5480 RepID=G8B5Q5_CANPC|nr:uncharacterized protein CPAR2_603650 [Candida parapsilosis]KAF6043390.1 hypothetical protein FOB58_005105 [Candida parapsilosis]KAF6044113.1 hypothetical protein FOB59_005069 [Candida parapsilosis]KAF6045267.1 hypothetical protein FOB60_004839 [Candida parapsilosis]KAF6060054.1 hypothetical protein FOB61_005069 [Candida parapsilosis]CAD1813734.1 unnamed protein product [Candida parapsilosis]
MFSPFNNNLPSFVLFPLTISSASSITRFMYSSNPCILPWIRRSDFSYSHTETSDCCCKNLNIRLIGGKFVLSVDCDDIG